MPWQYRFTPLTMAFWSRLVNSVASASPQAERITANTTLRYYSYSRSPSKATLRPSIRACCQRRFCRRPAARLSIDSFSIAFPSPSPSLSTSRRISRNRRHELYGVDGWMDAADADRGRVGQETTGQGWISAAVDCVVVSSHCLTGRWIRYARWQLVVTRWMLCCEERIRVRMDGMWT